MSCSKALTLSAQEDDTPLDQAIYSGAQDKIFGVRGKWLYKFNADTGKKESEIRFSTSVLGATSICEIGNFLYIGVRLSAKDLLGQTPGTNAVMRPERDIFKITTATIAVVGPIGMGDSTLGSFPSFDANSYVNGFGSLKSVGLTQIAGFSGDTSWFIVDPTNLPGGAGFGNTALAEVTPDIDYDPTTDCLWYNDASFRDVWVTKNGNFILGAHTTPDTIDTSPPYRGLTFCPAGTGHPNPKVYAVDGTNQVIKIDADVAYSTLPGFLTNPTWTSLFVLGAAAKPIRIKYNAQDDKIYIPTWSNDTVEVLDPATDTIVAVKTGFTEPFDFVVTATGKKYAVCNAATGLQPII